MTKLGEGLGLSCGTVELCTSDVAVLQCSVFERLPADASNSISVESDSNKTGDSTSACSMAELSPWRPQARNPQIVQLRQREFDVQLEFDVANTVIERRTGRAGCPSPDEQAAQAAVETGAAKAPIVSAFTAVNAHAGTSSRMNPAAETATSVHPGRRTSLTSIRPTPSASNDRLRPQELEDRDWEVVQVVGKRSIQGVVEYLVRWAATTHPAAVLRHGESGNVTVVVNGQDFAVCQFSTGAPNYATGEQQRIVEWKESYHALWELADAIRLVRKYEQTHPQTYGTSDKDLKRSRKDRTLQHPSWEFSMKLSTAHDQESRPDPRRRTDIVEPNFVPKPDGDYTASFLAWQRREITSGQCPIPTAAQYLNRPLRQHLRFNDVYFGETGHSYNAGTEGKLRALYVHVVGFSHRIKCTNCQKLSTPFAKCVSLGSDFNGACTCCQFLNKGQECSYHHHYRELFKDKMRREHRGQRGADSESAQLKQHTDHNEDEYNSSDDEDSGYGGSSPLRDIVLVLTDGDAARPLDKGKAPARVNSEAAQGSGEGGSNSTQETALTGSQEFPATAPGTDHSTRRTKRRKVTKAETSEDSPWHEASIHPGSCGHPWQICRHPTIGCVLPPTEDGSLHPPSVVFNNQRFVSGEATIDEVRYIISRGNCQNTNMLEKAWQDGLSETRECGEVGELCKEEFLSHFFVDWLNTLVKAACPTSSVRWGEVIDLTLEN